MARRRFRPLHVHSEYSILDGACRVPDLVARAAELEMPAVTLTDHGSMAGAVQLFKARGNGRQARSSAARSTSPTTAAHSKRANAHLTLLAADNDGYSNLIKLSSWATSRATTTSRVSTGSCSSATTSGLIALSGCLSGRVNKALEENRPTDADGELDRLSTVFGRDNVYVELQNAHMDDPAADPEPAADRARGEGSNLPLSRTGDVHYLRDTDARAHEALLCIQSGDSLKNPNHWKFDTDHFYFKSPAGDARSTFPARSTRSAARSRSPSAATSRSSSARSICRVRRSGRSRRVRLPRRAVRARPRERLRQGDDRAPGAPEVRAEDHQGDGLHRLLPDRLGLHPLRQEHGVSVGPGRGCPPACSSPTRSRSPTSTRSATTSCSSGS